MKSFKNIQAHLLYQESRKLLMEPNPTRADTKELKGNKPSDTILGTRLLAHLIYHVVQLPTKIKGHATSMVHHTYIQPDPLVSVQK